MMNMERDDNHTNRRRIFKNSFGLGLLLIVVTVTICENGINNRSTKATLPASQTSDRIFVDKDGQLWRVFTNYSNDEDSIADNVDRSGIFY